MRKLQTKLRRENDELQKEIRKKQKKIGELELKGAQLELSASRAFCKICSQNEVAVVFLPCEHAVICRSCYERCMVGKSKKERACHICQNSIKNIKNFILA